MSIGAALAAAAELGPTAISLLTGLVERFRGSKKQIEASSAAIAHASEGPEQLREALDTLKVELLALNDRTETIAKETAELARANQLAMQTVALQQRWLLGLSFAVVLAIGLAFGALLAR